MKKGSAYAAFTALILLLCLIPSLGMLLPAREGPAGGNQTIAAPPALRDAGGAWDPGFLSKLRDYAADNFFLRQDLITAWSALNAKGLHSSITEDVVLGRDGWLYFGDTLADYAGLDPMDRRELFSAARNLSLICEYCESQGARFLFTVAPNKNSLYPEHMPGLTASGEPHDAERLAAELERQGVEYLDCFALFRDREETLYFRTDSHWDSKGAALAADGINAALGRQSGYFAGPFQPEDVHRSDLYAMLYPTGTWLETDWRYAGELAFAYESPIRSENDLNIRTAGGGTGSLLMFRDSFGILLYPYLADSFASALFSRSMPCRLDLLAQREADFAAVELVERNLRYLIQNVPVMPAPRRQAVESVRGGGFVRLDLEPSENLPGCVLLSGTLPAADPSSPVLVNGADGGCYEAFLLEDGGFGLYLPESAGPESVVFYTGGEALRLPLVWQ